MAKPIPKGQGSLPGITQPFLPREKKKGPARGLAGLTAFFLRAFPDQGAFTFGQTRWALQKAMEKHGVSLDDMFIRINRMAGKHLTMTPWEVATCELPERKRRFDRAAPEDMTDADTDTSDVPEETREKVLEDTPPTRDGVGGRATVKVHGGGEEPVIPYHEKVTVHLHNSVHGQNPLHAKAYHADELGFCVEIGHVGRGGAPIRYFIPWGNITGIRYGEG